MNHNNNKIINMKINRRKLKLLREEGNSNKSFITISYKTVESKSRSGKNISILTNNNTGKYRYKT